MLEAIPRLDRDAETYALDVLSIIEATLDDPGPILEAQLDRVKTELLAELKAEGVEYEQRMEELAKLEHPKPLREFTYDLFDAYRLRHPWVGDHNIRPKSVARDLFERAMGFADYVADYKVTRSEGLLLRYLGDAYKGLVQNVPEDAKTDERARPDRVAGRARAPGRLVACSTSGRRLHAGADAAAAAEVDRPHPPPHLDERPPPVTANRRAFAVMVRNEAFRRVELLARRDCGALAELDADVATAGPTSAGRRRPRPTSPSTTSIGIGPDARAGARFVLDTPAGGPWRVRQVIEDPAGHDEWGLELTVDRGGIGRGGPGGRRARRHHPALSVRSAIDG